MRLMNKVLFWMLLACIALIAWMVLFSTQSLNIKAGAEVYIKQGSSLNSVAKQLVTQDILSEPYRFILLVRALGGASDLKAGNYLIPENTSAYGLYQLMTNGGKNRQASITFIEGWTFAQMRAAMMRNEDIKHVSIPYTDAQILEKIGAKESHPEGLFFPDTYFFSEGMSDIDILKRAYLAMQQKLDDAWQSREDGLPYKTAYEALIMASIVEKETGKASERPMIAGVFIQRLRIGMRLQTDPTVIYGMGQDFDGNIRRKDLLQDTPYNTYTRAGLPPTPIAMPGLAAIEAALHPAKTKALYFVGKGDGSHAFSVSLAEHNRAVAQYQLRRKQ
jgi:UPF0755 protein